MGGRLFSYQNKKSRWLSGFFCCTKRYDFKPSLKQRFRGKLRAVKRKVFKVVRKGGC